jgi:hypothetical protein
MFPPTPRPGANDDDDDDDVGLKFSTNGDEYDLYGRVSDRMLVRTAAEDSSSLTDGRSSINVTRRLLPSLKSMGTV